MMKRLIALLAALAILFAVPTAANAGDITKCSGFAGFDIYGGVMYEGFHRRVCANAVNSIGVGDITSTGFPDNYASSVKVFNLNSSQDLVFYSGRNYLGSALRFTTDFQVPNLSTYNFNNIISSVRTVPGQ